MIDRSTLSYFDDRIPEYSVGRLEYAAEVINKLKKQDASLVDIGCGTGNVLQFLKDKTGLANLCGIDISEKCLARTSDRTKCETFNGSILDRGLAEMVERKFDFAVLSAVLHHLVGDTRQESKDNAEVALENALRLVKDGGFLIVLEPTYRTSLAMDLAFYIKKYLSPVARRRIRIFKTINIGPPLVSYLSHEELTDMIESVDCCKIVGYEIRVHETSPLLRMALITRKTTSTIIIQKNEARPYQRGV